MQMRNSRLTAVMVAVALIAGIAGTNRALTVDAGGERDRDKTGTSQGRVDRSELETTQPAILMAGGDSATERAGLWPLCFLSLSLREPTAQT
jgi:hypothetical protein